MRPFHFAFKLKTLFLIFLTKLCLYASLYLDKEASFKIIRFGVLLLFILSFTARNGNSQVINRMQFDRFTHYQIDDWITYAPARFISSIDIGDDYVYFGSLHGGILRYQLYDHYWDFPFSTSSGLRSNHIIKIVFDADAHKLYAKTKLGIDVYNQAFDYWQPADITQLPERRRPASDELQGYREQGHYRYPAYYRPSLAELPDFFAGRNFIFRKPDQIIDTYNQIYHLNPERIMGPFRTLWLSTSGLGPASADPLSLDLKVYPRSLPNISPRDVYFDGDTTWIGGLALKREPNGITILLNEENNWHDFQARFNSDMNSDNVRCIKGNKAFVFFATDNGLLRYDKKNETWKTFSVFQHLQSDQINDLVFFKQRLFVATERGFNWLYPADRRAMQSADRRLSGISVYKMIVQDSTILLAAQNGLYRYFPKQDRLKFFNTRSSILPIGITAVGDHRDSLWLAGQNGIILYDYKTDHWKSFTQIQSRLNTVFHDIAFTPGTVWFASEKGLLKYEPAADYWYLYSTKDGLASNKVFHIDVDKKNLWLSTARGVTIFRWFRPDRIE